MRKHKLGHHCGCRCPCTYRCWVMSRYSVDYICSKLGHHCACRCPCTYWCWAISRYNADYLQASKFIKGFSVVNTSASSCYCLTGTWICTIAQVLHLYSSPINFICHIEDSALLMKVISNQLGGFRLRFFPLCRAWVSCRLLLWIYGSLLRSLCQFQLFTVLIGLPFCEPLKHATGLWWFHRGAGVLTQTEAQLCGSGRPSMVCSVLPASA